MSWTKTPGLSLRNSSKRRVRWRSPRLVASDIRWQPLEAPQWDPQNCCENDERNSNKLNTFLLTQALLNSPLKTRKKGEVESYIVGCRHSRVPHIIIAPFWCPIFHFSIHQVTRLTARPMRVASTWQISLGSACPPPLLESNSKVTSDSLVAYVMSLIFKGNVRFVNF